MSTDVSSDEYDVSWEALDERKMLQLHRMYENQDEEMVKSETEHLKCILVSKYSLQREMTDVDFSALGFYLKNSPRVEIVFVSDIEMKPEGLRALIPGLRECSTLRMWHCSLTAACCADLSSILSTDSSLTDLDLSENELMDSGVRALCEGLKHPECKIQTLDLSVSGLTDACTEALCSALSTNRTLKDLELRGNHFTQKSRDYLNQFENVFLDVIVDPEMSTAVSSDEDDVLWVQQNNRTASLENIYQFLQDPETLDTV